MVDISIIILTYNARWEKLKPTILSALYQKGVSFEIIISDDGSRRFFKEEIEKLFSENNFSQYKIITLPDNRGTVINYQTAVDCAMGEYVRAISPGDYLFSETSLHYWVHFMRSNNVDISFGDAVYYNDDKSFMMVEHLRPPRNIQIYKAPRNEHAIVINYLLLNDMALGAAFLTKRELVKKYLAKLSGRIFFGEDFMYNLMVAEGEKIYYYEGNVLWYEYGHGISTSQNSPGRKILEQELDEMHKIILESGIGIRIMIALKSKLYMKGTFWGKIMRCVVCPEFCFWRLYQKLHREYTTVDCDKSFFDKITSYDD